MGPAHRGNPLDLGVQDNVRVRRHLRLEGCCPTFWCPSIIRGRLKNRNKTLVQNLQE